MTAEQVAKHLGKYGFIPAHVIYQRPDHPLGGALLPLVQKINALDVPEDSDRLLESRAVVEKYILPKSLPRLWVGHSPSDSYKWVAIDLGDGPTSQNFASWCGSERWDGKVIANQLRSDVGSVAKCLALALKASFTLFPWGYTLEDPSKPDSYKVRPASIEVQIKYTGVYTSLKPDMRITLTELVLPAQGSLCHGYQLFARRIRLDYSARSNIPDIAQQARILEQMMIAAKRDEAKCSDLLVYMSEIHEDASSMIGKLSNKLSEVNDAREVLAFINY